MLKMNNLLNNEYFINQTEFNCAFCNEKAIGYQVLTETPYDWSSEKKAYAYTVQCKKCEKVSLHLSHFQMDISFNRFTAVYDEKMRNSYVSHYEPIIDIGAADIQELLDQEKFNLDELFFFHWPKK